MDVELVLNKVNLVDFFKVIIIGDDIKVSKLEFDCYLLVVDILN